MDRILWISNIGVVSLDTNYFMSTEGCSVTPLFGKSGFLLPPVRLITDKTPRIAGNVLRERVVESRTIDIPFRIEAPNYKQLVSVQRRLSDYLFGTSGNLVFNFAGEKRELVDCSYVGGFTGEDNDDNEFVVWSKMMLSFEAHDPYFYGRGDDDYISRETFVDPSDSPKLLDANFLDSMLAQGSVGDEFTAQNTGVDTAWGVWEIEGPVDAGFTVGLEDGLSFTINRAIADGEKVIVDTSRGQKTVTSSIHGDIFSSLDNSSHLWGFPRGTSKVKLGFTGFTGATHVRVTARIPYGTF